MPHNQYTYEFIPVNGVQMMKTLVDEPWTMYTKPFKCAPHVWYVAGQWWVSCYILDTGDGLILIDTGTRGSLYLLMDSIYQAGFNPRDIKKVFLTHAHGDHCDCVRSIAELTGAEIWLSKEDDDFKAAHIDGVYPFGGGHDFTVTNHYDDNAPIKMGRMCICTKLCSGHTPGTTSFFFTDTDEETGKTYRVALHGGAGVNQMKNRFLDPYEIPHSIRKTFLETSKAMLDLPVDICLSSHNMMTNFLSGLNENDRTDYTGFVNPQIWKQFMQTLIADAQEIDRTEAL